MDTGRVRVLRVEITREEIDFGHPTAGEEIAAALATLMPGATPAQGFPLAKERLLVEIDGVPPAAANAFRRVLKEEHRGQCLTFENSDFGREASTDAFMADLDFIRTRLQSIPLRPQIPESLIQTLRFALDAENPTGDVLTVYAGDLVVAEGVLEEPLFNPTHELLFLQPGRTYHIQNIHIVSGYGHRDAAFTMTSRAVSRPLDQEELPRTATHASDGSAATFQSGYVVSALLAKPRRHEVSTYLTATLAGSGAGAAILIDACGEIMQRLRFIQSVLEGALSHPETLSEAGALASRASKKAYLLVTPYGRHTKGVLSVRDETATIGALLESSITELMPEIGYCVFNDPPHEHQMTLTVTHEVSEPAEIAVIMLRGTKHAYGVFGQIQQGIRAKT